MQNKYNIVKDNKVDYAQCQTPGMMTAISKDNFKIKKNRVLESLVFDENAKEKDNVT